MIHEVEEEEPTGFIRLEKFQPMMARVLMERRYICVGLSYTKIHCFYSFQY
jgi:hypothetical protein